MGKQIPIVKTQEDAKKKLLTKTLSRFSSEMLKDALRNTGGHPLKEAEEQFEKEKAKQIINQHCKRTYQEA